MGNKLFGTDGVRGVANVYPMTVEFAFDLSRALSSLVCGEKRKVAIGKDTRVSGDMLESALAAGFASKGVSVNLLGVVPTPLLTLITPSLDVDMSLMITASHNPYQDNGIKLINKTGDKFSDDFYAEIEAILNRKAIQSEEICSSLGSIRYNNSPSEKYIEKIQQIVSKPNALKGLRIVLDCANGSYYKILPTVFKNLGAGVIAINNTPNGHNINENCGSQHTEQLSQVVRDSHAHFGIAVDGDGDRIILVDNNGRIIDGDQLLCFLAIYLKKHNKLKNNTVISTEWSNLGLEKYLKSNGYKYFKSKVGERYVIDLMKKEGSILGGEVVGHIVLSDYAKTGDALVVAIVLSQAYLEDGRKMSDIFPIFEAYPCIIENIRFSKKEYMLESTEHEDVKLLLEEARASLGDDSNIIARKSGTEPVIKLRVESSDRNKVEFWSERLKQAIIKYQK